MVPRACLGKNLTIMELSKIVPELLLKYDFVFEDEGKEWVVFNDWFIEQRGFNVRVCKRQD